MEQNTAAPIAEETQTAQAAYPPLCVKYNGAEKQLSPEEAVTYAQKGMNYDKIYERLKALEQRETLSARDGASPNDEDIRRKTGQAPSAQPQQSEQQELLLYRQKEAFLKAHPDIREVPPHVLQAAGNNHLPLEQAWRMTAGYDTLQQENRDLQRKLLILQEQLRNQDRSTGSVRGQGDTTPFPRSVGRMSVEEYEKYRDTIWRDLEKSRRAHR